MELAYNHPTPASTGQVVCKNFYMLVSFFYFLRAYFYIIDCRNYVFVKINIKQM